MLSCSYPKKILSLNKRLFWILCDYLARICHFSQFLLRCNGKECSANSRDIRRRFCRRSNLHHRWGHLCRSCIVIIGFLALGRVLFCRQSGCISSLPFIYRLQETFVKLIWSSAFLGKAWRRYKMLIVDCKRRGRLWQFLLLMLAVHRSL